MASGGAGRAQLIRRARLATGLVMVVFIVTHLVNHSLGLVSLEALRQGREWFVWFWRAPPATAALYGAILMHMGLGLLSLWNRRSLRGVPAWEIWQLLLGLAIPPLFIQHVFATRGAHEVFGVVDGYDLVLTSLWVRRPDLALWQIAGTLVVWLHLCVGLHFWLRLKPWYQRRVAWIYAAAILIPAAGLFGFISAGLDVIERARDPGWDAALRALARLPEHGEQAPPADAPTRGWFAAIALVLSARLVRHGLSRAGILGRGSRVTYPDGTVANVPPGATVLEASRLAGVPHASICGGRGRCSTCRVRLGPGAEHLPAPTAEEEKVLARVGAPPGVRLACQIRPRRDLAVTPLLPPTAGVADARGRPDHLAGKEQEIVILFADLRGFTRLSEGKLPYDVVFLLNRYFTEMGRAIEAAGGQVDKFVGDGIMALFGLEDGPAVGARQAILAAAAMARALDGLNRALGHDLPEPLRMGIGIHAGPAIVGEMGYGRAVSVTAIGDAVNTASRLEGATKELGVPLVISAHAVTLAGIALDPGTSREIDVRGRAEGLAVHAVPAPEALTPG